MLTIIAVSMFLGAIAYALRDKIKGKKEEDKVRYLYLDCLDCGNTITTPNPYYQQCEMCGSRKLAETHSFR